MAASSSSSSSSSCPGCSKAFDDTDHEQKALDECRHSLCKDCCDHPKIPGLIVCPTCSIITKPCVADNNKRQRCDNLPEHLYTCGVCMLPYDAHEADRTPHVLRSCGHTFCWECIHAMSKEVDGPDLPPYSVECPCCKIVSFWNETPCLPINYAIIDLVGLTKRPRIQHEDATDTCNQCNEHPATAGCHACKANFCETCWQQVHAMRVFAGHQRDVVSNFSKACCTRHPSMLANIVCIEKGCTSHNERICPLCRELPVHKDHAVSDINDYARKRKADLRLIRNSYADAFKSAREKTEIRFRQDDAYTKLASTKLNMMLERIDAGIAEITRGVNARKSMLYAAMNDRHNTAIQQYAKNKQALVSALSDVANVMERVDTFLDGETDPATIIDNAGSMIEALKLNDTIPQLIVQDRTSTYDLVCCPLASMQWVFNGAKSLTSTRVISPPSKVNDDLDARFIFYPKGNRQSTTPNVNTSLFIESVLHPRSSFNHIAVYCILCLVNQLYPEKSIMHNIEHVWDSETPYAYGIVDFSPIAELTDERAGFILNDRLVFACSFIYMRSYYTK